MKSLPKGLTHYKSWGAVPIAGPLRVLLLSDLHVPYHDEKAIDLAIKFGKDQKANAVIINGDLADFYALSSWETDPRKRDLLNEIETCTTVLEVIRDNFPKAKLVVKEGNHEERWERYINTKAAALRGLPGMTWNEACRLNDFKALHVGERRRIALGKMSVIHGHEYRFNISNPVSPSRGLFLRAKVHAICGHFHQSSQHSERRLDDEVISTWSQGCLCEIHPDYGPINNWNHGFAFVEITSTGAFQVTNTRIIDGKVYS